MTCPSCGKVCTDAIDCLCMPSGKTFTRNEQTALICLFSLPVLFMFVLALMQ